MIDRRVAIPYASGTPEASSECVNIISVCRGRRSRSGTSSLPALATNVPPAHLLNASRLDDPLLNSGEWAVEDAGPYKADRG